MKFIGATSKFTLASLVALSIGAPPSASAAPVSPAAVTVSTTAATSSAFTRAPEPCSPEVLKAARLGKLPLLRLGSRGAYVRMAQLYMLAFEYMPGAPKTTNVFGPGMRAAVKQFQADKGLKPDGVIGKQTWRKLSRACVNV